MPTSPERPFTDEYLLRYSSEHVFYEVDRFFWLADVLGPPTRFLVAQSRLRDIFVEGFVLHLRNVIEFLYPRRKLEPTDIVAADFLPDGRWDEIRPPLSDTLKTARRRANKQMAHLTSDRIFGTPPEKHWDSQALANELQSILRLMCDNALSSRLAPNVVQSIRQLPS